MSYATFPTLAGIGWPVVVSPNYKTVRQQTASGAQFNTSLMSSALHTFTISINYLSSADYSTLKTFFETQLGGAIPFYFTPTNGSTYLVTFDSDSQDFSQFLNEMYETGTIKLREFR